MASSGSHRYVLEPIVLTQHFVHACDVVSSAHAPPRNTHTSRPGVALYTAAMNSVECKRAMEAANDTQVVVLCGVLPTLCAFSLSLCSTLLHLSLKPDTELCGVVDVNTVCMLTGLGNALTVATQQALQHTASCITVASLWDPALARSMCIATGSAHVHCHRLRPRAAPPWQ